MSIKTRLTPQASRAAALEAARALLLEAGPQAVTLKAVSARMERTHANLLHHFGTAAGLQQALAAHLAGTICGAIAQALRAAREGDGGPRAVVDLVFDAFGREGGGALASWMRLTGNDDALEPIVAAIHDLIEDIHGSEPGGAIVARETTQTLVLLALGDALMGGPLAASLSLPRDAARAEAERMLLARGGLLLGEAKPAGR